MFDAIKLKYKKGCDYLQTRSRAPRRVMPNIALYCDWILWDNKNVYVDFNIKPKTIYARSHISVLNYFIENILNRIDSDFILLTTSCDLTMPLGFHRKFNLDWEAMVNNKYLKLWVTENRDLIHEKIKPIPLGLPHPDLPSWIEGSDNTGSVWDEESLAKFRLFARTDRILKIFGCWYPRADHPSGTCPGDKNERQQAYDYFIDKREMFDWHPPGLSRASFNEKLGAYQFVLCPHGGGLDPNPRCWEALIMRSVPIVKRNSMSESLEHLPIAIVDEWSEVTIENMKIWKAKYERRLYDDDLEYLMSNSYYFNNILKCL